LDKNVPLGRAIQRSGIIVAIPVLGGLHHQYVRDMIYGRDNNDRAYGHTFQRRVRAMGIRDRPISPGSPWQNGIAERLIGTLRRECLDQMVICSEAHLRRILSTYAGYYNQARTHLALQKDAPLHRTVQPSGAIVAIPILAGLHHQYVRI
jgi:transposase InsO family protein